MRKIFVVASVLVLLGAFVSGAVAQEVKIGSLMAFTGPLKEFGPNINNGVKLAVKQATDAGLSMKLYTEDSETSPIPAVNAAKKLVDMDKVVGIIGALSSGVTIAVAESVTCPNDVIMISPASTSPLITVLPADKGKDFLFRTCPSDALQAVVAGDLAASYNKTASVIYVNNPYGQGLAQNFKKAFEKVGGKVLAMVPIPNKPAPSYAAELKKALAGHPDRLCVYSYPEQAKIYVKQAIELYKYKHFLFCDGTKSMDIMKAVGAKYLNGQMGTAPGEAKGEAYNMFNEQFKAAYGKLPPLPFITNAYDGASIIGLAAYAAKVKGLPLTATNIRDNMRAVANPPGEKIYPDQFKKAFELLKAGKKINYEGAAGSCDFDKNGDVVTPIQIWKYSKGQIVDVRLESVK